MKKIVFLIFIGLFSINANAIDPDRDFENTINKMCERDNYCITSVKSTVAAFLVIMANRETREDYFQDVERRIVDFGEMSCEEIGYEAVDNINNNVMSDVVAYAAHYMVRCKSTIKNNLKEFE
jgi:Zn-dependent oligopeptidase